MTVKVQRPQNSGVGLDVVPVEGCHDQSYEMGGRRWSTYLVTEKLQLQGYEDLAPELHQVGAVRAMERSRPARYWTGPSQRAG